MRTLFLSGSLARLVVVALVAGERRPFHWSRPLAERIRLHRLLCARKRPRSSIGQSKPYWTGVNPRHDAHNVRALHLGLATKCRAKTISLKRQQIVSIA